MSYIFWPVWLYCAWKIFIYFRRSFFEPIQPSTLLPRQVISTVAVFGAGLLLGYSLRWATGDQSFLAATALAFAALATYALISISGLILFWRPTR